MAHNSLFLRKVKLIILRMKNKSKVFLQDYVLGQFKCSCAYYYYSTNRIDPDCFVCSNKDILMKIANRIRHQTMKEVLSITKRELAEGRAITETTLTSEDSKYELDFIWLN
jgi:hypothetical protein